MILKINGSLNFTGENNCGDWSDEKEEYCPCADSEKRCNAPPTPPGKPGECMLFDVLILYK